MLIKLSKAFDLVLVLLNIILSAILYSVIIKVALIFFRVFPSEPTLFLYGLGVSIIEFCIIIALLNSKYIVDRIVKNSNIRKPNQNEIIALNAIIALLENTLNIPVKHISFYIKNKEGINAGAFGNKQNPNIWITSDLLLNQTEWAIATIIHELGHIKRNHHQQKLLALLQEIKFNIEQFSLIKWQNLSWFIIIYSCLLLNPLITCIVVIKYLVMYFSVILNWQNEYQADSECLKYGYSQALVESLTHCKVKSITKLTIKQKIFKTHPPLNKRIARLNA